MCAACIDDFHELLPLYEGCKQQRPAQERGIQPSSAIRDYMLPSHLAMNLAESQLAISICKPGLFPRLQ